MRWKALAAVAALLISSAPLHARITRIVIDETAPAFCKGAACASYGEAGQYEQISGRVEYNYTRTGDVRSFDGTSTSESNVSDHTIKAGLNYNF